MKGSGLKRVGNRPMKVVVVGGGSGGHIVPALAVVEEMMKSDRGLEVEFWTDRKNYGGVFERVEGMGGGRTEELKGGEGGRSEGAPGVRVRKVAAGKFQRYNWRWYEYFLNLKITLKDLIWGNLKGFCGFIVGLLQSFCRLIPRQSRPAVIFLKGGFVGLPVGLVAGWLGIPYVIHESDATLGLANRILARRAAVVATGLRVERGVDGGADDGVAGGGTDAKVAGAGGGVASVEDETVKVVQAGKIRQKWIYTGVPVAEKFQPVGVACQRELKQELGFNPERPLVMVTGGSQGAVHLNEAVEAVAGELVRVAEVGLVTGRKHYEGVRDKLKRYERGGSGAKQERNGQRDNKQEWRGRVKLWAYSTEMEKLLGAADVVVSRAGATTIAELAALGKAVVLVPFEKLPGGHQLKNAQELARLGAAEVVADGEMVARPELLLRTVVGLVEDERRRRQLAGNLRAQVRGDAAARLAEVVLAVGRRGDRERGRGRDECAGQDADSRQGKTSARKLNDIKRNHNERGKK